MVTIISYQDQLKLTWTQGTLLQYMLHIFAETNLTWEVIWCLLCRPKWIKSTGVYSDLCGRFPTISSRGNKYIYAMYVYDFNAILSTAIKNISYKEMIRAFTYWTEGLKIRVIHPGFHFMDNKVSTTLKLTMTNMNVK